MYYLRMLAFFVVQLPKSGTLVGSFDIVARNIP
jgi:hypothetical protein